MRTSRSIVRLLRRGDTGDDVKKLQEGLLAAGHDPGSLDGVFGPKTELAVKAFQKAHQLQVDGVVGSQTWSALNGITPEPAPPSVPGSAKGVSLHIGLNNVDPAAYPFPVPVLHGCINDANDMAGLAASHGFQNPQVLLDAAATSEAVSTAVAFAAQTLNSGDFFFFTYSGHGSQIVDVTGGDDESDRLDETWVLWDRQLLDDELRALWSQFRPGVRIFLLSDSCHSGTVARDVLGDAIYSPSQAAQFAMEIEAYLRQHLDVLVPSHTEGKDVPQSIARQAIEEVVNPVRAIAREIPSEQANYEASLHRKVYVDAKENAQRAAEPQCSVLLISGCQDDQTSSDGQGNGLFTQRLLQVMAEGSISNYIDLYDRITRLMPARQKPNYFWATTPPNTTFEAQAPLTI